RAHRRPRQPGPRRRHERAGGDHPARPHQRPLQPAAGRAPAGDARAPGGSARGRGLEPRRHAEARHRRAGPGRQPDQRRHRDVAAEGGVSQPGAAALAEPVRQGAAAAHHPQERAGGPRHRPAARARRDLRVRDPAGPDGAAEADRDRAYRRRDRHRLQGPAGRRAGRRRRAEPAARRDQGGHQAGGGRAFPRSARRRRAARRLPARRHPEGPATVSISEPFIRRPVATALLTVGLLLAGLIGYKQLPVSALPQVDYPTILVSTLLPGASAETMASAVTTPLERQFGQMPALAQMTSISSFGTSQITLQFELDRSIDAAEQDVQAAINAASNLLPRTLPAPPTYSKSNPADTPILSLSISSDTLPLSQVDDYADSILAQKISQVSGVGLVTLNGGQKPAVRVQVDAAALAGAGLTLEDVRA